MAIGPNSRPDAVRALIRSCDLTSLEGSDTPDHIRRLASRAMRPVPHRSDIPPVAALCVYPSLLEVAVEALAGSYVRVAVVAGGFPSGQIPIAARVAEVQGAVMAGADEVDFVLNRGALLSGDYSRAFEEIRGVKDAVSQATLKVILEVGELGDLDTVKRASMLALAAGADFIKTSTGKIAESASVPAALVMMTAIRDWYDLTGILVGLKVAGGIRSVDQALQYLFALRETLGSTWMNSRRFRIGASSLLDSLVKAVPVV